MFARVFRVGLMAGLAAGLAMAALQHFTTTPLIQAAERYEHAATQPAIGSPPIASAAIGHDHGAASGAHDHGGGAWSPADGLERTLSTTLATVLTAIGYSLVLIAAMLAAGEKINPRTSLAWAAGAFAATGLATGLGLPPELPGGAAADLVGRQLWWVATAAATGSALFGLIRIDALGAKIGSVILLIVPHVIGPPTAPAPQSTAPAELAAHFASTSLAVHAAFWLMIGAAVGMAWQRTASRPSRATARAPA